MANVIDIYNISLLTLDEISWYIETCIENI